jgi:hypothetical protein
MRIPSLRGSVGASVAAGLLGAGLVDALWVATHGGAAAAFVLGVGLYGAAALGAGLLAELAVGAILAARMAGAAPLRTDAAADRAVTTGILATCVGVLVAAAVAFVGQRAFVGKMASAKLAAIAAGGLVAIGALPGAVAALAAVPLLRRLAAALPRPRAL